jgi:hypothetical protein
MSAPPPRPTHQRLADTFAKLSEPNADVWVASTGPGGAHLVPLSLAWIDERVVIALPSDSVTGRNIAASGKARLAVGPTRDVVMIDAELDGAHPVDEAPGPIADGYAAQSDWDPRGQVGYSYLVLRPLRVQAWREANEISGRTLMRDGVWTSASEPV